MGELVHSESGKVSLLREHHIVGRQADQVDTWSSNPLVSRIHASVTWKGEHWQLRDLSTHGTWLNGVRVQSDRYVALQAGDTICLSSQSDAQWQLVDSGAPRPMLRGVTGDADDMVLSDNTFLPSDDNPDLYISFSAKTQSWVYSVIGNNDEALLDVPLTNGDLVSCKGRCWRAILTETTTATRDGLQAPDVSDSLDFRFDLTLDEENTTLSVRRNGETIDLGERAHHYLLMHLARSRAQQAQTGVVPGDQGWVDCSTLCRDLGLDEQSVNLQVFRARQQLSAAFGDSLDGSRLVERKRGKLRFGLPCFTIVKGGSIEYSGMPTA